QPVETDPRRKRNSTGGSMDIPSPWRQPAIGYPGGEQRRYVCNGSKFGLRLGCPHGTRSLALQPASSKGHRLGRCESGHQPWCGNPGEHCFFRNTGCPLVSFACQEWKLELGNGDCRVPPRLWGEDGAI